MHVHQSVLDKEGNNIFADLEDGRLNPMLRYYIGGLQHYVSEAMPLFAPNVNSYRRFLSNASAPVNLAWGVDNRTVSLRVPESSNDSRRVENRLPGADANPYLCLCGLFIVWLFRDGAAFRADDTGDRRCTFRSDDKRLPLNLEEALELMADSDALKAALGTLFVSAYVEVKRANINTLNRSLVRGSGHIYK